VFGSFCVPFCVYFLLVYLFVLITFTVFVIHDILGQMWGTWHTHFLTSLSHVLLLIFLDLVVDSCNYVHNLYNLKINTRNWMCVCICIYIEQEPVITIFIAPSTFLER
jgi:hypothetical protein